MGLLYRHGNNTVHIKHNDDDDDDDDDDAVWVLVL